jgi:predicted alpha/beta-fold hydrolase
MRGQAPAWLPGGHLQTIWAARVARAEDGPPVAWRRERWNTPDADFVDVDWVDAPKPDAPTVVLFHGLEGSRHSHYARAFACVARARGWRLALPHFRGCSGEINLAPRAYHSGDSAEIEFLLQQVGLRVAGPCYAVGVSLGGNALMRWAGEQGAAASQRVRAVASICAPLDLLASGRQLGQGFNLRVYTPMFLQTMKRKARQKWEQFPELFDLPRALAARDLWAFDDAFTAPVHGYRGVEDYWTRASAKPLLPQIQLPALLLNARNDPFIPASSLPQAYEVGPQTVCWQPDWGGHVGFAQGPFPGQVLGLPQDILDWLGQTGGAHG